MYLVTGGAGFIGSHLVERLVEGGHAVRVLDSYSTGKPGNLQATADRIEFIEGDIRDEAAVRRAVTGVKVIFHQAAISSVQHSVADPRETFDVNVGGTLNVLLAAREAECQRVVFASSASVYGDDPTLPKTEAMVPRPISPYAVSKLTGEHLCVVFAKLYGLETVALRYFNVFGPRQDPSSPYSGVIARFLDALRAGSPPVIYGDGEQSRDFVYVSNVVDANLAAAERAGVAGGVFNVASGRATSLLELLRAMAHLHGGDTQPRHEPARPGDIRHSRADISEIQTRLGYVVRVPFEAGLRELELVPVRH